MMYIKFRTMLTNSYNHILDMIKMSQKMSQKQTIYN